MLVWFGVTLTLLTIVFGALTYFYIEEGFVPLTQDLAHEILKANAADNADEMGRQLESYRIVLRSVARGRAFRGAEIENIRGTLARVDEINPDFELMAFADLEGRYITSKGETGWLSDFPHWESLVKQNVETVVSEPIVSRKTGEPTFLVAVAVTDDAGQRVGTLGALINLKTMFHKAKQLHFARAGGGWIADGDGRVIAHGDPTVRMKLWSGFSSEGGRKALEILADGLRRGEPGRVSYLDRDGATMVTLFNPIPGSPGWTYGVAMPKQELLNRPLELTRQILRLMVGMVIVVLLVVVVLSRKVSAPILHLQKGVEAVSAGNLEQRIDVRTGDEIQALADAFNRMTGNLRTYIANLETATAEREHAATELELARRIQESSLPERITSPGIELASVVLPAREIAGDFYEFFPLPQGRVARAAQLLRSSASMLPPQDAIAHVNAALARHNPDVMFLTLFFAIWSPADRALHYVNAGHNPPLLLRADGTTERLAQRGGPALGPMRDRKYSTAATTLEPGDLLAMYSDGITEAPSADGVMFGEERLGAMLRERIGQPLPSITGDVTGQVMAWQAGGQLFDDVTLLLARVEGPVRRLDLAANVENIETVVELVRACAAEGGMEAGPLEGFALAVCEAVTNVITHALGSDPARMFRVFVGWSSEALVARVEDEGPIFGLEGLPSVDVGAPLAERPVGGLGLLLIRRNCDDVRIERIGATNILTLVRRWPIATAKAQDR